MTLTNEEINILLLLIDNRIEEVYNGPEGIELYWKPEVLQNISKKLEKILFQ